MKKANDLIKNLSVFILVDNNEAIAASDVKLIKISLEPYSVEVEYIIEE